MLLVWLTPMFQRVRGSPNVSDVTRSASKCSWLNLVTAVLVKL